jgi:hypothetical protein
MALPGPSKTLRVELERGSDPIRGSIGAPDGPMVPFTGWMELAAALEAAHVACDAEPRP